MTTDEEKKKTAQKQQNENTEGNTGVTTTATDNNGGTPATPTGTTSFTPLERLTTQTYQRPKSLDDTYKLIQEAMAAARPETKEEQRERERRERARAAIAGIGDLGSAFANLYHTTKYAPNVERDPKQSLSAKAQERVDKAKAEREKNKQLYYNYAMTLRKLEDAERDRQNQLELADRNYNMGVDKFNISTSVGIQEKANDRAQKEDQFNKTFGETVRSHKANETNAATRNRITAADKHDDNYTTLTVHSEDKNTGDVEDVALDVPNTANWAGAYNLIPSKYRGEQGAYAVKNKKATVTTGQGSLAVKKEVELTPKADDYADAVGRFLSDPTVPMSEKQAVVNNLKAAKARETNRTSYTVEPTAEAPAEENRAPMANYNGFGLNGLGVQTPTATPAQAPTAKPRTNKDGSKIAY